MTMLFIACALSGCDKTQAIQDASLSSDPVPEPIIETIEYMSERDPMAYIVRKNILKFPEIQVENYPVTFFWVSEQGVYDALGMNFEQIKQHVHDEKLLNFVRAHIVADNMRGLKEYKISSRDIQPQTYKNILGNEVHLDLRYTLNDDYQEEPFYEHLAHVNGIPINWNCSGEEAHFFGGDNSEIGLLCNVKKALF